MAQKLAVQNIAFVGLAADSKSVSVENLTVARYRVTIDNVNQITGQKSIPFTETPSEGSTFLTFELMGGMNTSGTPKLVIGGVTIPDIFASLGCIVEFEYTDSVWTVRYFLSSGVASSINGSNIIDNTITPVKITDAIAGSGMARNGGGGIIPNLETSNPSLQVSGGELGSKLNAAGGITKGANGIQVNIETTNPSLQIDGNEVGLKIDASGGIEKGTAGTAVKVKPGGGIQKDSFGIALGTATYHIIASFDADSNNGSFMVRIPYTSQITAIRGMVSKEISGTDGGTIEFRDATSFGGGSSPLAGPFPVPMSSPLSTVVINEINTYTPAAYDGSGGWYLQVVVAKTTDGGQVYLSIDVETV